MVKQLLLISALSFSTAENTNHSPQRLIYFEQVFRSPHDAYLVRGETVDGKGLVHSFCNRNSKPGLKYREWNLGKKDFEPYSWFMTPAEVEKNLSMTDSVIGSIPPDTLSKYIRLLALIDESNKNFGNTLVIASTSEIRDNTSPNVSLYGFIYDGERKMYKRVLIDYHRGVEWQNQSEYVGEFKQWKW